jgi:amino-acid N-acetyltransferase
MTTADVLVRRARTADVPEILALINPLVEQNILLGKQRVQLYETVQEFVVAVSDGTVVGCGALHPLWADLGEVRTIAVATGHRGRGIGGAILAQLEIHAIELGLNRLFCLTFEVDFFAGRGFVEVPEVVVEPPVFDEMSRSADEGVAEFLNLARVKLNTLGNTRMLKTLPVS